VSTVDQRHFAGPFDVIGDVHGCADELEALLGRLDYRPDARGVWRSTTGRTAVFVGDFVDRGPRIADVLRLGRDMVTAGTAFAVPGNHDIQFVRYLAGQLFPSAHGLDTTLTALDSTPDPVAARADAGRFLTSLPGHVVLDAGKLVVAHAGLGERFHLDPGDVAYQRAVYGVASGPLDAFDLDRRHPWLRRYRGAAVVVYGHTAITEAIWQGSTINIDTGCCYGGTLTALRWPERTIVSVPAARAYAVPVRALTTMEASCR